MKSNGAKLWPLALIMEFDNASESERIPTFHKELEKIEEKYKVFARKSEREGEKMMTPADVRFILLRLRYLDDSSFTSDMKDQYFQLINELKYLQIYMLCLSKWRIFEMPEESGIEFAVERAVNKYNLSDSGVKTFDYVDSRLLESIQECKPKIAEDCLKFLDSPFDVEFSIDELQEFMGFVSTSLHNLLNLKADMMLDVKVQIESLQDKLDFFQEVLAFAAERRSSFNYFKIDTQAWPCYAACISLLYWVLAVKNEIKAQRMDIILSDLRKKISPIFVDFILKSLDNQLKEYSSFSSDMEDQCLQLIYELKYLKIYMWCSVKWNDSSIGKDKNFGFVEEFHMESALEDAARKYRMSGCGFKGFDILDSQLLKNIQLCKPKITEDCLNFIDFMFECKFSIDELAEFMSSVSASLRDILYLKTHMMFDVRVQFESLQDNLDLCKEFLEFSTKWCSTHEDLENFKIQIQAWACRAACAFLLYWTQDAKKENTARTMDVILSGLQKRINCFAQDLIRMYLSVLKATKPSTQDGLTVRKLVWEYVEFLKSNLQVDPEKDEIQMLFIDLIFLVTFLADGSEAEKLAEGKSIAAQADAVVNDLFVSLISSFRSGQIKEGIAEERDFLLHTFLQKANAIKVEVRKLYAHLFPDPSSFTFPRINVLGFIDSLLENLKKFNFHFPKYQIMMLHKKLLSLKESNLKDFSIIELQNKHKDVKDLWTRIVNVAYNAERVTCSFIYMNEILWHDILYLSDVIEEVKLISVEMKRIQDQNIRALNSDRSATTQIADKAPSEKDVEVVGLKKEINEIRGQLISGSEELHILSIFGMPGLGKTTLANKVYSDAAVGNHFNRRAWCTVSQTFNSKRMFSDILRGVTNCEIDDFFMETEEDLAERVYRSLKGQRYLIVIDDIWDAGAWRVLEMSFPNDQNGSRIIFTSRIDNVVSEPRSASYTTFPLKPLSEDHSWELLEKKLFDQGRCPSHFVQKGKQIAKDCEGLPLSIVLIAGVLKEKMESLDWWEQIRRTLNSLIAKDSWNILDLSYKHLPEFLKSCFLYFGLFQEDEEIMVKKLILLWISEGFVEKHETKSSKVVAEEYFMDLVSRSLVIVTKRSSTGRVKACSIHDLLHDFCLAKGKEEKLIKVTRGNEDCRAITYAHYRVCIQNDCWRPFLEHSLPAPSVHSLLYLWSSRLEEVWSFSYFKFLRVLDLDVTFCQFPEELVLLRHLAIKFEYSSVPPSIKRLENLETLCLYSRKMRYKLPHTLWEMQNLRHVSGLVKIPTDFCDRDIAPLQNVEAFSLPTLDNKNAEIFLRTIPKVRKLKFELHLSGDLKSRRRIVKFDFLTHLESLSVRPSESTYYNMPKWSSPVSFPSFPLTLKKLSLTGWRLPWSEISPITNLPNLEVLKLRNSFRGRTWNVGDEEFLKLKCLMLITLDIEQLNVSDYSFNCLERLVIRFCENLEEIPSRFASISTLKLIQAKDCLPTLNRSVMEVKEEQVDLGNEHLDVLISM